MNRKTLLTLILVVCLVLSACTQSKPSTTDSTDETDAPEGVSIEDQTFVVAVGTEARTLDPHFCTDGNTSRMIMQMYEGLVTFDTEGKIVGALATDFKCADDGVTWTFNLRDDVDFHCGNHFNAESVKYTFERFMNPDIGSPRRSIPTEMIKEITAVSDTELQITTISPFGDFIQNLASYSFVIMCPEHTEEHGKEISEYPCGTGPLKLKSWEHGTSLTFERFEEYYGEPASPKEVKVVITPEDATRTMLLQSGDVDIITDVPPIQVPTLKADENITLSLSESYRAIYLGMNTKNEKLSDPLVRRAINYAIDKESIINHVLGGVAVPAFGVVPTSIESSTKDVETYPYNPEKAKELLSEAGYPDGFNVKLFTPEGRYPMDKQVCEAIQPMLAGVGINAEIQVMEWAAYNAVLQTGEESELYLMGKNSPTGDPYYDLSLTLKSGASNNYSFYSNPVVDDLMDKIKSEINNSKRNELLVQLQQLIQNDAPWAVLYYQMTSCASQADVTGLVVYPNEIFNLSSLVRN